MSLGIYTTATADSILSSDGTLSSAFAVTIDGRTGGSREQRLYIRNNSTLVSYSGINLTPVDLLGTSVVDGTAGYSWKLSAGDTQPTTEQWDAIDGGNTISLGELGTEFVADIYTYLPFWIRIEVPRNAPINMFTDVVLRISATEILI